MLHIFLLRNILYIWLLFVTTCISCINIMECVHAEKSNVRTYIRGEINTMLYKYVVRSRRILQSSWEIIRLYSTYRLTLYHSFSGWHIIRRIDYIVSMSAFLGHFRSSLSVTSYYSCNYSLVILSIDLACKNILTESMQTRWRRVASYAIDIFPRSIKISSPRPSCYKQVFITYLFSAINFIQ